MRRRRERFMPTDWTRKRDLPGKKGFFWIFFKRNDGKDARGASNSPRHEV